MYKVFIIDDERLIIDSIIEAIEWDENGFELMGFDTDAEQALNTVLRQKPDLIFCDLKMPLLSGIDFIKKCRADGLESEFIMLSAFAEFEASRDFFVQGGFDYLLKPVDKDTLQLTLDRLSPKLIAKNPPTYNALSTDNAGAFDELLSYLDQNYNKKHTLKSLSARFFISETYICDLFAKNLATTFKLYMVSLRMQKALELIQSTSKSMKEIALLCGYSDYFYFCRVFKSYYGKAPSEYR